MKKLLAVILIALLVMFAEYRFIMRNIAPAFDGNGVLYLEIFGIVDTYCVE